MSTERAIQKTTTTRNSNGKSRRIAPISMAVLLMASTLLSFAPTAQAAAGDFTVIASDLKAGADATYTITYFTDQAYTYESPNAMAFTVDFARGTNGYFISSAKTGSDYQAISHQHSTVTHSEIYDDSVVDTDPDPDQPLYRVGLDIDKSLGSNAKVSFTVAVRNPNNPGTYTLSSLMTDGVSGGGLLGATPTTHEASTTITIVAAGSGANENVALDLAGKSLANEQNAAGTLKLTPHKDATSIELEFPLAFGNAGGHTIAASTLGTGWTVTRNYVADDPATTETDESKTLIAKYQGTSLKPDAASTIAITNLDLPAYVGSFTFNVVERGSGGQYLRGAAFTLEVAPNDIDAKYIAASDSHDVAGSSHTMRFLLTPTTTIDTDADSAGSLTVKFPAGFDLSGVTAGSVDLDIDVNNDGAFTTADDNVGAVAIDTTTNTIVITLQNAGNEKIIGGQLARLYVRDLVTPNVIGTTDALAFATTDKAGRNVDGSNDLTFTVLASGAITDFEVEPYTTESDEALPGHDGRLEFNFDVDTANPSGFRLTMPSSFELDANGLEGTITVGETTQDSALTVDAEAGTVQFDLQGLAVAAGATVEGNLTGLTYPLTVGAQDVEIRSLKASGAELDTGSATFDIDQIDIGTIDLFRAASKLKDSGEISADFESHGLLTDAGSKIRLSFTGGYSAIKVGTSSSSGITVNGVEVPKDKVSLGSSEIIIELDADTAVAQSNVTVTLDDVENPNVRPSANSNGKLTVEILAGANALATGSANFGKLELPDDAPLALHLTNDDIREANKAVQVTVRETRKGIELSWTLPVGAPTVKDNQVVPVEGVQIWSGKSPYTFMERYDADDEEFKDRKHIEADGDADARYLVTMYYAEDVGKFTGSSAPDENDYVGTGVTESTWTWQWFAIGGGAFLLIALVAIIALVRANRN